MSVSLALMRVKRGAEGKEGAPTRGGQKFRGPATAYRGTSLIRNSPSPQGHHRALGIVLL